MTYRGIIFDFDGTLADTLPLCCEAIRQAIESTTGKHYTDREIIGAFGPTEDGIVRHLTPGEPDLCVERFFEIYDREHERFARPIPGITAVLDRLRERGIPIALVTGKGERTTRISLARLGLDGYFDPIETGSVERAVKPELMRRVLDAWRLPPDAVVYVGDDPNDVNAGRAAGIEVLAAAWAPGAPVEALQEREPLAVLDTVDELGKWIQLNLEMVEMG